MKTSAENFYNNFESVLQTVAGNKNITNEITNRLKDKMSVVKIKNILSNNIVFEDGYIAEFYLVAKELYNITQDRRLRIEHFFDEQECLDYDKYKETINKKTDIIVFENVTIINDKHWSCVIDFRDLYKCRGEITYNIRTQRNPMYRKFGDSVIKCPTIKQESIEAILKEMEDDNFTSNTITFNIRKNEEFEQKFKYDEVNKTLTIWLDGEGTFLDIIDGQHRLSSIIRYVNKNPKTEKKMILSILNYTEDEARSYIKQEQTHTPMPKEFIASLNKSDPYIEFAKTLNTEGSEISNSLFKKVVDEYKEIKKDKNKLVTFLILSKGLESSFNFTDSEKVDDIAKARAELPKIRRYLIEFFNQLMAIITEKYGSIDYAKKKTVILENTMFLGHLYIAKLLYNTDNWEDKLKELINRIDYNKNNDVWNRESNDYIGIYNPTPNNPAINKILKYFERMCS